MASNISYGALPFSEQIAFFKSKTNLNTQAWTDIYADEHNWSFVVAGANRDALVADFRAAIENVIDDGGTLEQFRTDFDTIVAKHGWDYKGGRNWRSRVIYETNLRSSYQAGRYAQLMELRETMPYWEYFHSDAVEHPRQEHLNWDGLILRYDDPWWLTHFPVNAWGCQCGVTARSADYLKRTGRQLSIAPPNKYEDKIIGKRSPGGERVVSVPAGIDPGFEYTPGRSRLNSAVPPPVSNSPISGADLLPAVDNNNNYVELFLNEFGATVDNPVIFNDAVNNPVVIGAELFTDRKTRKIMSELTHRESLLLLAKAIKTPDEIWTYTEYNRATKCAVVKRRYVMRVTSHTEPTLLVMFETGDGWSGSYITDGDYQTAPVNGALVYRHSGGVS